MSNLPLAPRHRNITGNAYSIILTLIQNCNQLSAALVKRYSLHHFPLSGKIILLTKKKITIDTPPFRTVVPIL